MVKTIARLLLLRVLPRRVLPIVTVVEALLFLRGIRNRSRLKVNPPTRSQTAPPTARPLTSPAESAATADASPESPAGA